ncbi:hypothetical protein [Francisella sp. SYW-9]|uniref:hypothetical protein n=1 Tax=Francisella sp. SYW-9 TaxID=2610888 RepID=UPI00123DAF4B|nr:hypothetical protein [Francisella sp. SYW-9]
MRYGPSLSPKSTRTLTPESSSQNSNNLCRITTPPNLHEHLFLFPSRMSFVRDSRLSEEAVKISLIMNTSPQSKFYRYYNILRNGSRQIYPNISIDLCFYNKKLDEHVYRVIFCETPSQSESLRNLVNNTQIENLRAFFFVNENVLNVNDNPENVIVNGSTYDIDEILLKITNHMIKIKLKKVIKKSVEEYIMWSKNQRSISIFKRHGKDGIRRASALYDKASKATSIQEVGSAITSFFNNSIRDDDERRIPGSINTNNHSFISFFLNQLKDEGNNIIETLWPNLRLDELTDYTLPNALRARKEAKRHLSEPVQPINLRIS